MKVIIYLLVQAPRVKLISRKRNYVTLFIALSWTDCREIAGWENRVVWKSIDRSSAPACPSLIGRVLRTVTAGRHTRAQYRARSDARTQFRERNIAAVLPSAIDGWLLHEWITTPGPLSKGLLSSRQQSVLLRRRFPRPKLDGRFKRLWFYNQLYVCV